MGWFHCLVWCITITVHAHVRFADSCTPCCCGVQIGPAFPPLSSGDGPLSYDEIKGRLDEGMAWLAKLYCNTMNVM